MIERNAEARERERERKKEKEKKEKKEEDGKCTHKKEGGKSLDTKGVAEQVRGRVKGERRVVKLGALREIARDKDRMERVGAVEGGGFRVRYEGFPTAQCRYPLSTGSQAL